MDLRLWTPETIAANLDRDARAALLDEGAAVVAYTQMQAVIAQATALIPEAERDAAEAEKAHVDAQAGLREAKEELQRARQALDKDAKKTAADWAKVPKVPMMQGSVYRPGEPEPMLGGAISPNYRPQSRERVSLELAEEDASGAVRSAERELVYVEGAERKAQETLRALQRHVEVLGAMARPETPTLDLLRGALK